jgi:hypothetical protein
VRTVAIVNEAKYLGSWIDRTGGDELDIERRITAASKAFGELSKCVFRSPAVSKKVKAVVYMVIVATVLLSIVRVRGMGVDDEVVAGAEVFPHELCTYNRWY